ncbi:thy-1 membrane glycoprotein isoform 1-T2 [Synchiropus picturatus]
MFLLTAALLFGLASAQKVIQMSYCAVGEDHLRVDCKYALPAESTEAFCKYTQGERLLDSTDPEEEQPAAFKTRARARLFPGNICRLLYKDLPKGKSNFTCNIRPVESPTTVSKTWVIEKKLLLPCSSWSLQLHSCSALILTFLTLPALLETHWL